MNGGWGPTRSSYERIRQRTRSTSHCAKVFGDIFISQFPFTSGTMSKVRPVLVLFDLGQDVIVCRVTSAPHGGQRDVVLSEWQAAGLLKPSVARLDRLVTAEKSVLLRRLGCLTSTDSAAVRAAWNRRMRL